jgi:uncharacterized Ntn-hydrolase superfamily protein
MQLGLIQIVLVLTNLKKKMKNLIVIVFVLGSFVGFSQHTFSIVAVDSITGEIGSAGATCISTEDGAIDISDIVLGVGAIHTQAYWTTVNQNAAHTRMVNGDSPAEIITWLQANGNNVQGGGIADRQYGVVDLNNGHPRTSAYTGNSNWLEKGHRVGANYTIQGNILISQDVLDDMETAVLNTTGDLSTKLMAVMQAAKRPGADSRCLDDNISSASAFIRVAKPTDTNSDYGNLWLDINVWAASETFTGDPIDELQVKFDDFKLSSKLKENKLNLIHVFPNPIKDILEVNLSHSGVKKIKVTSILGEEVAEIIVNSVQTKIDFSTFSSGMYVLTFFDNKGKIGAKKVSLVK